MNSQVHRALFGTVVAVVLGLSAWSARASEEHDHDNPRSIATVSFGAGLNTAQPGNAANHHVLPPVIRIKKGGVVNFLVAGFHQVWVFQPGKAPAHVVVPATGTFIDDVDRLYYRGIHPAAPPPAGISNAQNRVESVSFAEPGVYLVICNVRPHFLDGMYASVVVHN